MNNETQPQQQEGRQMEIRIVNEKLRHIVDGERGTPLARIKNTPRGWLALRGDKGSDPAAVIVSDLINQTDGAERILHRLDKYAAGLAGGRRA